MFHSEIQITFSNFRYFDLYNVLTQFDLMVDMSPTCDSKLNHFKTYFNWKSMWIHVAIMYLLFLCILTLINPSWCLSLPWCSPKPWSSSLGLLLLRLGPGLSSSSSSSSPSDVSESSSGTWEHDNKEYKIMSKTSTLCQFNTINFRSTHPHSLYITSTEKPSEHGKITI